MPQKSNDKDKIEEFDSSSMNTQVQGSKKLHPSVKCKYCPKKFKCGLATHMQKYTNSCINAPESAKTIKTPKLQNSNLTQEQNSNFTQAVYSSGIPLSTFKNSFLIEFFNALQPSFQTPSRDRLSTGLLENLYEDVKNDVNHKLNNAQNITIVSDSWSNINRKAVQNFIICLPNPKIIEEKYPHIICFGCALHVINLLICDILKIDAIKSIMNIAKTAVKYFKDHTISMAKLRYIQKENYNKEIALVLPAITQWGTHFDCIKSLIESQIAI
ncbi:25520_t:CDS:2 [Gigaspora margarita]|uniref:25520_t:CDS:1 n=1 Tax=Gigaspora margarita TaxID=4874 RepID=A0ABN7WGX3_GIGMA|nr:25520_t:CDS:2 [Gigaspora margarita]